jgi:lysophospholipase L1-like esterase
LSGDTVVARFSMPGMLSRVPEVVAMSPDIIVLNGGINDIINGTSGAQVVTDLKSVHDLIRASKPNVPIILLNVSAPSSASGYATSPVQTEITACNAGLASGMTSWGGFGTKLFLVDQYTILKGASGTFWSDSNLLVDTLHPGTLGGYLTAKAVSAIIDTLVPAGNWLTRDHWATGNLITAGTMAGTAGGKSGTSVTGTVATALSAAGPSSSSTFVMSKEANAETGGESQVITYSIASSASTAELLTLNFNTISDASVISPNTPCVRFWLEFEDDGAGLLGAIEATLSELNNSKSQAGFPVDAAASPAYKGRYPSEARRHFVCTQPHIITGTQTSVKLSVALRFNPASRPGSGVIKLRRAWMGVISDPKPLWNS